MQYTPSTAITPLLYTIYTSVLQLLQPNIITNICYHESRLRHRCRVIKKYKTKKKKIFHKKIIFLGKCGLYDTNDIEMFFWCTYIAWI